MFILTPCVKAEGQLLAAGLSQSVSCCGQTTKQYRGPNFPSGDRRCNLIIVQQDGFLRLSAFLTVSDKLKTDAWPDTVGCVLVGRCRMFVKINVGSERATGEIAAYPGVTMALQVPLQRFHFSISRQRRQKLLRGSRSPRECIGCAKGRRGGIKSKCMRVFQSESRCEHLCVVRGCLATKQEPRHKGSLIW